MAQARIRRRLLVFGDARDLITREDGDTVGTGCAGEFL
jgi:hypothetical protein